MVAALLSVDRVSGDGRNETVSLIMTVFPSGPGAAGHASRPLRLRLACPVLARCYPGPGPAPVTGDGRAASGDGRLGPATTWSV